jgi:hypothetical protein
MNAKAGKRVKHVPQRTCVGCRLVLSKRQLIRVVRTPDGIVVDHTGKMAGRGAYLHDNRSCWEKAVKGALANALRTELTNEDKERIAKFASTLTEKEMSEAGMDPKQESILM